MSQPYPKATRAADRARVAAIDTEVSELEERIRVLQLEREPCKRRLDAYIYPVLTLPNEITSEIFIHFLPPYPACPRLRGLESPTSLTHICRQWREIALATPKLWRAFSTFCTGKEAAQARVVQTWLDRSRSCQLSIRMVMGDLDALVAILLHRQRWQNVELVIASSEAALIKGPFPLLESLSLSVDDFHYTHPTTSFGDFPRLQAVTVDDARHGNWLPASQFTSLTFEDVASENYLPLLHGAANLVRLNLIHCDAGEPPQNGVNLARLETLVIVDDPPEGGTSSRLLDMFTVPALHSLCISGELLGSDPISSLNLLISRSGCKLQQVLVTGESPNVPEKFFRAAFPSIPKIAFDSEYDWSTRREFRDELNITSA
ncbi:hypothetical protein FB45DRAFT_1124739 [Roridomyces roridus]|uniref:F-box domain-containing protein n=1 Tax=Roridomyces roridus TaxID=1738132 RepID=A0AAD7C7C7_9AGAR|nr:hypothetical protein FB45DRAFT_1124739 [Roridomyces roridus]